MENKDKIILDLCGGTGSWSKPYKDAGYDVHILTLPDVDIIKWTAYPEIVKIVESGKVHGIFCAPPCTMFSRARTTAKTPRDFRNATRVVRACIDIIWECQFENRFGLTFWAIENPAGHLKRFLGEPALRFQPYEYGDRYSKQTWLWGMFNEPKKNPIELNEEEILRSRNNTRHLPEIPEDYKRDGIMKPVQIRRSITPSGFARAFFDTNSL